MDKELFSGLKILIVEDEQDIRELIELNLRREGFQLQTVASGTEALQLLESGQKFDLWILDWMIPGASGIEIAKALRALPKIPAILMVTARAETTDILLGLEAGADDYVTKPFEVSVLLARVRALLRRQIEMGGNKTTSTNTNELQFGELRINEEKYEVRCKSEEVHLTRSEFRLLIAMAKNHGKVLTREQLIGAVQGLDVSVTDRTVDTHVFGLRKKLGECGSLVETIRGIGYRISG